MWTATGGLSLDNTTIASITLSGVPKTSGGFYLTVTVTDSYVNKATDESVIADAASVYNHLNSVSVSSATAGSAFNQVFTVIPSPADDGSYSYSWNSVSVGLTIAKNGATATVSGTPTDADNVTGSGFATDSYGKQHGSSTTITVNAAPVQDAVLTSASANPHSWNIGDAAK